MAVHPRVRRVRTLLAEEPRITQRELAAHIGIHETELSRWLSGRFILTGQEYSRIHQAIKEIRAEKTATQATA